MHLKVLTKSIKLCYKGSGKVGQMVKISIGKKESYGIISGFCTDQHPYDLKEILISNVNYLSEKYIKYIETIEFVYLMKGFVVKYINKFIKSHAYQGLLETFTPKNIILTEPQLLAYNQLFKNSMNLLWGITGSGKTAVILKHIIEVVKSGKQALILIPEIAIAKHMYEYLLKYNIKSTVWNSKSSNKTKFYQIMHGHTPVVIGTRSSIFLPFQCLDLIVVDEEHSGSYTQESNPSYNGRDCAYLRAKIENIRLILMSATPSTETIFNTPEKIHIVHLKTRYNNYSLPTVYIVKPKNQDIIDSNLMDIIKQSMGKQEKVLIFCNRRAMAPVVKCKTCNYRLKCNKKDCVSTLVSHKTHYQCHKCNTIYALNNCIYCGSNDIGHYGYGVDKVCEYLLNKIPKAKVGVLSSDHFANEKSLNQFLDKVYNNYFDIIIGTQMISKGHNFNLSVAILLNIDNLGLDFKTSEQSMQTIIQVSGRIGRQNQKGRIYIQKRQETPYDQAIIDQDYHSYINQEISLRKEMLLPPFSKLIYIKSLKHHTKILDKILAHNDTINIFMETSPEILLTCKKNTFPYFLNHILSGIRGYKLIIY